MEDERLSLATRVVSFFLPFCAGGRGVEPGALSVHLFSTNPYFIYEELRLGECSVLTVITGQECQSVRA